MDLSVYAEELVVKNEVVLAYSLGVEFAAPRSQPHWRHFKRDQFSVVREDKRRGELFV